MSLYELGTSTGEISPAALLDRQGNNPRLELEDLAAAICRGGWPAFRELELSDALRRVRDYLNEIPRDALAVAALQGEPGALMRDLNFMSLLFESMVIRDLRIYAQTIDGEVMHYQDSSDLEVDAIVQTRNSWGAFEVKLGGGRESRRGRQL